VLENVVTTEDDDDISRSVNTGGSKARNEFVVKGDEECDTCERREGLSCSGPRGRLQSGEPGCALGLGEYHALVHD